MTISVVYAGGWGANFEDMVSTAPAAIDHGTGANRVAIAIGGYVGGVQPTPTDLDAGADSFDLLGSLYTNGGGDKFQAYIKALTVTGNQTPSLAFSGGVGGGGFAQIAYLILQGDAALTVDNILAVVSEFAGGGGGTVGRTITNTAGDLLILMGGATDTTATVDSPATLITSSSAGKYFAQDVGAGTPKLLSFSVGTFQGFHSFIGFSVREARAVGIATEADAALALAGTQLRAAGLSAETDTSLALSPSAASAAGTAAEADSALALAGVQLRAVGLAAEADTALALDAGVTGTPGIATETDTAFALAAVQVKAVGLAAETSAALPLAAVQARAVGLATEADGALPLAALQIIVTGFAAEVDAALALTPGGPMPVGMATETDLAFALLPGSAGGLPPSFFITTALPAPFAIQTVLR